VSWRPQVGERVRIRVSAECPYCVDIRYPASMAEALANDGRAATVVEIGHTSKCCAPLDQRDPVHLAHEFWVKWEERLPHDDPPIRLGDWECPFDQHFALTELVPMEETP
jgi:hypothetical protein